MDFKAALKASATTALGIAVVVAYAMLPGEIIFLAILFAMGGWFWYLLYCIFKIEEKNR